MERGRELYTALRSAICASFSAISSLECISTAAACPSRTARSSACSAAVSRRLAASSSREALMAVETSPSLRSDLATSAKSARILVLVAPTCSASRPIPSRPGLMTLSLFGSSSPDLSVNAAGLARRCSLSTSLTIWHREARRVPTCARAAAAGLARTATTRRASAARRRARTAGRARTASTSTRARALTATQATTARSTSTSASRRRAATAPLART